MFGVLRCQIELKDLICRTSDLIRLMSRFADACPIRCDYHWDFYGH